MNVQQGVVKRIVLKHVWQWTHPCSVSVERAAILSCKTALSLSKLCIVVFCLNTVFVTVLFSSRNTVPHILHIYCTYIAHILHIYCTYCTYCTYIVHIAHIAHIAHIVHIVQTTKRPKRRRRRDSREWTSATKSEQERTSKIQTYNMCHSCCLLYWLLHSWKYAVYYTNI